MIVVFCCYSSRSNAVVVVATTTTTKNNNEKAGMTADTVYYKNILPTSFFRWNSILIENKKKIIIGLFKLPQTSS